MTASEPVSTTAAPAPARPPRKLVLCLDGTNDELGVSRPTNPGKVFEMLDLDHPASQVAYYDPGVGTLPASTARGKLEQFSSRVGQLAFGQGMQTNVMQAYTWLMNNYQPGDTIYVFGFSRGAYTSRVLTSMLARPGLLRAGSDNLVEYAVKEFAKKRTGDAAGSTRASAFADALCWGTADQPLNPNAPAGWADADRIHSVPVEFLGIWDTVKASGLAGVGEVHWPDTDSLQNVRRVRHAVSIDERRRPYRPCLINPRDGVDEVWFAGVHSDVGGTFENCDLATIALKWVFEGACDTLLLRDDQPAVAYAKWCTVQHDFALAKLHDNGWAWKLLVPVTRAIPDSAVLHASVQLRRQHDRAYLPNLANADADARWTDPGWEKPFQFH